MRSSQLRVTCVAAAAAAFSFLPYATAQTSTDCNPLESTSCDPDTALGKSLDVDFTSGSSSHFTADGTVTYDSTNGAAFTISEKGDAPTLISNWYIMFGKVTYTLKAAPGQGVVSSAVLQSDDLDEIDWEWVGNQQTSAQTNYFGKGITTTYDRGGNEVLTDGTTTSGFHTYTVEWTDEKIVWSIDGTEYRTLTAADAETNQYPQTPCKVKVGIWAGGDPDNSEGTIEWAGGEINYSDGPYTMYLKELSVTDYSTGTEYKYGSQAGTWESIESVGGSVNGNIDAADDSSSTTATATSSTVTTSVPEPFGSCDGWKACESTSTATHTGWPWVTTGTTTGATSSSTIVSYSSASSAVYPSSTSSSPPSSQYCSGSNLETVTSYNQQGFPTTVVINPSASKSYDSRGFEISSTIEACSDSGGNGGEASSIPTTTSGSVASTVVTLSTTTTIAASSSSTSNSLQADTTTSSTPLVYATTNTALAASQSDNVAPTQAAVKKVAIAGAVGVMGVVGLGLL